MTKKILIGLFILLIAAVSIVAYNFYKNVKQPVSTSSLIAVPQNAAVILQENNFSALYNKIASTNIIWEELISNTETVQHADEQLHYFDSLINHSFKPLSKQAILSSIHLSGANNFDFIFYMKLPSSYTEEKIVEQIKNTTNTNASNRVYDDVNIYTIITKSKEKIAFCFYKSIFSFSFSTVLIEDVIRQLNSDNSLKDNPSFAKVLNTSGQAEDGNIYINNNQISKIIDQFLNPSAKKYSTNLENYANWSELDIKIKPNAILMNGFTLANDSNNRFLALFKDQKPQVAEIKKIAPANTALLYHYGFSNAKLFFEKRKQLLKSNNQYFAYQKFIDKQNEEAGIDIEEELLSYMGNELALIITEPLTDDYSNNQFIVFQANDIKKATKSLSEMALKVNEEPSHSLTFNGYQINKVNIKNVFPMLLGKPFPNINTPFYTIIDDYLVFGQRESAIKTFISDYINNKTLAANENFQAFNENLSSETNLFVYLNIARSVNLLKSFAKIDYVPLFEEKIELFRKFEAISFQVNTEKNNLYYNNIYLKYNPVYKQDTRSLWETKLDANISGKPHLMINHRTNNKEIFVQDDAHKIYLISNTGKVIWTKQLQHAIIGDVHQIDVYKNNKLQLLFNTKNKIYLLDRNGENVEKFPVKLKAEATNGITPLDYSKNRNYRLLIGCNDNMVYNYTVQGNLVDGWKYKSTESYAHQKIWHFVISNKDYIVIPLKNGQIKIVERSGKERINLSNKLPVSENKIFLKTGRSLGKTYLITIDTSGIVHRIYLNNKIETVPFEQVKTNESFSLFNNQYLFTNNTQVKLYNDEKEMLFELELPETITKNMLHFNFPKNNTKIGITTESSIYLITPEGLIEEGFPLVGSTLFSIADINQDKTLNLVVGSGDKIITYNLK